MLTLCTYNNLFFKKLVELFYSYDTDESGSVQVVVDNTRNRIVYNFYDHDLVYFP